MSVQKGALMLIIAALIMFGMYVLFINGVFSPILETIGDKFNGLVDSVTASGGTGSEIENPDFN